MARNYGTRYIREQEKRYGCPRRSASFEPDVLIRQSSSAPPEGFQRAIMEWLDNELSAMIKRNIRFNKGASSQWIHLKTTSDTCDEPRQGRMVFYPEKVEVVAYDGHNFDKETLASVEYAHPQIFEILQRALTRFYNGV